MSYSMGKRGVFWERLTDAWNNVTGTEGYLLSLREVLVHISVELELSDISHWNLVFGPDLGGIQNVEFKVILL